ncbi:MAG: DUF3365 domain-containing protein [Bacteroidota bacterium]
MKILLTLLLLARAAPTPAQAPDTSGSGTALLKSRIASSALVSILSKLLSRQMAAGGPVKAMHVCADTAQALSDRIQREQRTSMRRVTERWRNPSDAPDAYETRILRRFEADHLERRLDPAAEHFEVVEGDSGREFRYLRPLFVQTLCLSCHGERSRMKDMINTILQERYPGDRAVGYRAGDFRGAVSIRIPLPQGKR